MHGFCSFIYNILLIFLSLFSLSVSILGCYKSTQLCPSQFASNPPNTVQPPLNHHHHNPSQLITTHDIPITKSTKNKGKSNPKSNLQRKTQQLRTQNQTFNKNPSTQTQVLESYGKGKDQQKKMKRKDHGRWSRDRMWFCDYVVGVKSEWERKLLWSFLVCKYLYNMI